MYEAIGRGLTLWARNIPLLSAITLTVWLPGNIAINYVASQSDSDTVTPADFWLPTGIETIFGPLCVGAVIYALDRRWQARRQRAATAPPTAAPRTDGRRPAAPDGARPRQRRG